MNPEIESKVIALINRTCSYSLPIDVHQIAQHMKYVIKTYGCSVKLFDTLGLTEYAREHPALSLKHKGRYYIFVSDTLGLEQERKVIAHEIGHIVLNHLDSDGILGKGSVQETTELYENEADKFAFYLLAPIPMIATHKIQNIYDIKKLTMLSITDCGQVLSDLIHYKEKNYVFKEREKLRQYYEKHLKNIEPENKNTKYFLIIILLLYNFTITFIAFII